MAYRASGVQNCAYEATQLTVKGAQAVAEGDLCYRASGDGYLYPAGSFTWDTNLATTQAAFTLLFAGVAGQTRVATQTADGKIRVDVRGVFWFDCAALGSALAFGNLMGPAKQSGNLLEPQKVVSVATASLAIGRLAEDAPVGATRVKVEVDASLWQGGPQAIA